MSTINWQALATQAVNNTDQSLHKELASLTTVNTEAITAFIQTSNIDTTDAIKVLKIVDDAALSNEEKATEIGTISHGINFLTALASKILH